MVIRRKKKYRKKLGGRTYSGNTKNRRGKGTKGGGGPRVGSKDHKFLMFLEEYRKEKGGFTPPRRRDVKIINVGDLEDMGDEVDLTALGYDKLLGRGRVTKPITVKVAYATESAVKKIEEAGGKVITGESESS